MVNKLTKAGRTHTKIALLDDDQRVTELARMRGGQTAPARQHAQALSKQITVS